MRRTTLATLLLLSAFGTSGVVIAPRAHACSGAQRGNITSRLLFPADGSTSVPTNVQIVVTYVSLADTHPIADHLVLKAANGASVPVSISQPVTSSSGYIIQKTFVLAPAGPLAPNAKYSVFSDIANPSCVQNEYWQSGMPSPLCTLAPDGGAGDGGVLTTSTAISGFTTGTGPDNTPPTQSGDITYDTEPQSCDSSPCCGPYSGFSVSMRWSGATDGGGPLFYELSREGSVILYPIQTGTLEIGGSGVRGAFLCSGHKGSASFSSFGFEDFQGLPGNYQVVAVDLAGNRSQPISVDVTVPCDGVDGGAVTVDAAALEDAPGPSAEVFVAQGDALGPSWDGLYAIALDARAGQPDLAIVIDVPRMVDVFAAPDDVPVALPDAGISDAVVAVLADAPAAAEDLKPATPDASPARTDVAVAVRTKDGNGCSCRVAGGHDGLAGFALVALGIAFAVRARRRRGGGLGC